MAPVTRTHQIDISGAGEVRDVRAEVFARGRLIAASPWRKLGTGQTARVTVTVAAEPGTYKVRQVRNVGSNVHEDLVAVDLGTIQHA